MKQYVLGFAFNRQDKNDIVLMLKTHPDFLKGKWNCPGGEIQAEDASPLDAMVREFKEETGVHVPVNETHEWNCFQHFATLNGLGYKIWCFRVETNLIYQCKTQTDEKVEIHEVWSLYPEMLAPHLHTLISLALDANLNLNELNHINLNLQNHF